MKHKEKIETRPFELTKDIENRSPIAGDFKDKKTSANKPIKPKKEGKKK